VLIRNSEKRASSPLWLKAVERYRAELEENDDYQDIMEVGSLEALLDHTKTIESLLPPERTMLNLMNRLGARLRFVDDFSAIIALYFGADANLTALVWGSIRLMLTLASSAGDTLQDILDMLEELSLTLPRFKAYENSLLLSRALETALLDVYTEVICFYARAIRFFRSHPHVLLRRDAWDGFHKDFGQTVHRIKRLSSTVESEADLARMQQDKLKYKEVLDLVEGLKDTKNRDDKTVRCYHIPLELSPRFWGREEALQAAREALHRGDQGQFLRTFALYGIGGVGKTQIALQYAKQNRHVYNAILWVSADNSISIGQSFREIACSLRLVETPDELQDAVAAILKVKRWLSETRKFSCT
jgi:ATP-dependent Clp protease ATP-binding subunit ClpA